MQSNFEMGIVHLQGGKSFNKFTHSPCHQVEVRKLNKYKRKKKERKTKTRNSIAKCEFNHVVYMRIVKMVNLHICNGLIWMSNGLETRYFFLFLLLSTDFRFTLFFFLLLFGVYRCLSSHTAIVVNFCFIVRFTNFRFNKRVRVGWLK